MTTQQITLACDGGLWTVSFDNSNVFGPQAGQTYPVPSRGAYDAAVNFSTIASDLLRRFPCARVSQN